MKRLWVLLLVLMLAGCKQTDTQVDQGMKIRYNLLESNGCEFDADITADYGDEIYIFRLRCSANKDGTLLFTVLEPESIAGISGSISKEKGVLTFDDKALAFSLLADGQLSPVCAPWIMVRTIRSGYLSACGDTKDGLKLEFDDSYADDALHLDVWADGKGILTRCEILWQGRRYLTMDVVNFKYL